MNFLEERIMKDGVVKEGNVLKVGDKVIAAKKAGFGGVSTYGGRKANTVAPNGWFANYIVLPAGQQVYLQNMYGQPFPVKVTAKDESTITFDANHEMAGKELNFQIEIVEIL